MENILLAIILTSSMFLIGRNISKQIRCDVSRCNGCGRSGCNGLPECSGRPLSKDSGPYIKKGKKV